MQITDNFSSLNKSYDSYAQIQFSKLLLLMIFIVCITILFPFSTCFADTSKITYPTNGHQYQYSTTAKNWADAKTDCESQGGYLATVTSEDEHTFIINNFPITSSWVWLGATDSDNEGTWKWITGEKWEYTNWYPGEPDNVNTQNCLDYYENNKWDDCWCDRPLYYLCEWGDIPEQLISSFDLDSSGIDYTDKSLNINFKQPTTFENELTVTVKAGASKLLERTYVANTTISAIKLSVSDDIFDQIITAKFETTINGSGRAANINIAYDQITALAPESVIVSKKLKETKINLKDPLNNLYNYFENQDYLGLISRSDDRLRLQVGTAITHRIIDLDKVINKRINTLWQQTEYASKIRNYTNHRIPILLIHGWQGDNFDFQDRQQSSLLLWANSELHYWQHFLDYYLASQKLQEKFHIYLYHYPTYKHINFNAKILNELLSETLRNDNDLSCGLNANKLIIIGHSMGGLVARDLIEEQGFNSYIKLITLDTPHHGSPVSDDDGVGTLVKDLGTQGAADLNWDNVDKADSDLDIDNNNANNRWAHINTKDFDALYWDKLQTLVGATEIDNNHTKNPWLRWLNVKFSKNYSNYNNKYILYVAAMLYNNDNFYDIINNGFGFNTSNGFIGKLGYTNGGAEPTGSAFFSSFDADYPFKDYFMPSTEFTYSLNNCQWLRGIKSIDTLVNQSGSIEFIISKGLDHPYKLPYRLFIDYDHEKIVNGCYSENRGDWDKYISASLVFDHTTISDTAFNSPAYFTGYAGAIFSYLYRLNLGDTANLNPLRYEPLFNLLQKDLLSSAQTSIQPAVQLLLTN